MKAVVRILFIGAIQINQSHRIIFNQWQTDSDCRIEYKSTVIRWSFDSVSDWLNTISHWIRISFSLIEKLITNLPWYFGRDYMYLVIFRYQSPNIYIPNALQWQSRTFQSLRSRRVIAKSSIVSSILTFKAPIIEFLTMIWPSRSHWHYLKIGMEIGQQISLENRWLCTCTK
jgi:hypothetical protein